MGTVWGVVVAGGAGTRFGGPKQFLSLGGRTVAEWSVEACRAVCSHVVLVVPAGHGTDRSYGADAVVEGGPTRAASVRAGLAALGPDASVVVVHDAARPLARPELFEAVVAAVGGAGAAGAICAVPVSDTVKRVAEDGTHRVVVETLERRELVAVQTPQAFDVEALRAAHVGDPDATDDAALVEALGRRVVVVAGDPGNVKLTTPADLEWAERRVGS